jgi:predicted nucleic acid-binding protein
MDASAVLSALINAGAARQLLSQEAVCVPDVVDVEVINGLHRAVQKGRFDTGVADAAFSTWRQIGVRRFPTHPLLQRVWSMREQFDGHVGTYVALAEALECGLVTADPALSAEAGVPTTVVPN